jgi:hypothetical protein
MPRTVEPAQLIQAYASPAPKLSAILHTCLHVDYRANLFSKLN